MQRLSLALHFSIEIRPAALHRATGAFNAVAVRTGLSDYRSQKSLTSLETSGWGVPKMSVYHLLTTPCQASAGPGEERWRCKIWSNLSVNVPIIFE